MPTKIKEIYKLKLSLRLQLQGWRDDMYYIKSKHNIYTISPKTRRFIEKYNNERFYKENI
jgi:hypothetical protein